MAERFLDFTGSEIYEQLVWDVIEDREIAEFLNRSLRNQEKVVNKEFALGPSGTPSRILSCSIMPLVKGGEIHGSLIFFEDITERKSKEARLRRAESLASLTTLAAGVAHEIKNPLGSISIHIQLIQKAMNNREKIDTEIVRTNLEVINEEVNRLNSIVVDFLFAVRPMDVKLEEKNLNEVVGDVLDFVQFELEEQKIEVKRTLEDEIPDIQLDEKYVKQALLNLIKNAISAMPEGGTITVTTRSNGENVFLDISDTGIGISEELMDKIFEPYFTTKDFGSGLGLTVVYKIMKEHMGEIGVKSREGEGTTFTLTFPIPQKEQKLLGWKGENDEV